MGYAAELLRCAQAGRWQETRRLAARGRHSPFLKLLLALAFVFKGRASLPCAMAVLPDFSGVKVLAP